MVTACIPNIKMQAEGVKHEKKAGAMLLALCLMAGMTATAFAQGDPATEPAGAPPAPQETTVEFDSPDVFINIGEEQKLNVKVTPEVAPEEIQWKSSDEKIVTVDQEGKIHGVAGGEAFVSAEADGVKAEILIDLSKYQSVLRRYLCGSGSGRDLGNSEKGAGADGNRGHEHREQNDAKWPEHDAVP